MYTITRQDRLNGQWALLRVVYTSPNLSKGSAFIHKARQTHCHPGLREASMSKTRYAE